MNAKSLLERAGLNFQLDGELRSRVRLGIGGRAAFLAEIAEEKRLTDLVPGLNRMGVPIVWLGGGSNVAFADGEIAAVVLVNRLQGIHAGTAERVVVASGVRNETLLRWCLENQRSGLEFLAGIPGTVGGAVAVNAGAFGACMADCLISARILDRDGAVHEAGPEEFGYSYRDSRFKYENRIILEVTLRSGAGSRPMIGDMIRDHIRHRMENHPPPLSRSAGCFFVNPAVGGRRISAGKLLEECGLKGKRFGAIRLSDRHANFLINDGSATFAELERAESAIRTEVLAKRGISLRREVIYITSSGKKT